VHLLQFLFLNKTKALKFFFVFYFHRSGRRSGGQGAEPDQGARRHARRESTISICLGIITACA
jgi:hypothetical protein